MAKHSRGKHSKPKAVLWFNNKTTSERVPDANSSSSEEASGSEVKSSFAIPFQNWSFNKERAIKVGIGFGVFFSVLGLIYFAGVIFFYSHFMPTTYISSRDLSYLTPEQVSQDFSDVVSNYSIKVKGYGLNSTFTSSETGIDIDTTNLIDVIKAAQNPWEWPVSVFQKRDMSDALAQSLSATKLSEVVADAVNNVNLSAKAPENAKVEFDPKLNKFVVIPEDEGTTLNPDKVLSSILNTTMALENELIVREDMLMHPSVRKDDSKVVNACKDANKLVSGRIDLILEGATIGKIDASQISEWVIVSPDYVVSLNDDAMTKWATELAGKFSTVGSKRTFTRPDGKQVTVKGGDYGWSIDNGKLISSVIEYVTIGYIGSIDIPVIQKGNIFALDSDKDWGNRYVDVDISQQYARFYGDDGSIIWEADVVTGAPEDGRSTPTGVYDLNSKGRNITLVGRGDNNEITYETPVSFWMPFRGNAIGFHDATWQSAFGGSRYLTGYGSHGCVNLSYSKAEQLYGLLKVGDVVVVHY